MPVDPDPNGPDLPKVLRDLVALSAVSSLWVGRESQAIATDLAELLATLLNLDFAFVCLCDSDGNGAVEVSRGTAAPILVERLQRYRNGGGHRSNAEVGPGAGDGGQGGGGLVLPLGVNAELGLVAAASDRPDFPSEIDRLLLSVAAGHGATAFKMARLVEAHQRAVTALATSERELRQAHDELETKVAERTAELRRSDAYLAEAHRLSRTGTWAVKNLNGELAVVYWSEESYRIYGLDPRQGLPTRAWVWQQAHPDDRDRLYAETEEAQRQKKDFEVEFRILLRDGTVKHVEAIGHHVFSARGELLEILGTHVDVTERKRAQEALRESEAKFRDYAESASDWFWEIDPDGKFTLLTENAFGSDAAQRIGTVFWDHALDLETESEKWRLLWETLESRKPFRDFVYSSVGGNGSPMYVKASGKPVFDANGEFRGYRGTGTDVTATMRAQEEHERLHQLESDLAHLNRLSMMGVLAASLAHEVKQPIATARNNARAALNFLARRPPDLGEVREALGCIVGDADRAGEIIDRIRAHIKKAPPRKDRFDLNEAVTEVVELARSAITRHGVSVQMRPAAELLAVQGDRVQLQQVILNLTLNAIEAMSSVDGPRELLISTEQRETTGLVSVRDSGPGIDPERLERVFEAFYTTKSNGVGIGLSICRSIIDAHGGRLWIEANKPRGATFHFTVPSAASEISSRPQALHHTGGPHEDSVPNAAHQPASVGSTRPPHLARGPRRRHRGRTS
ncbi:MAG TPA: ATP-binding protein [Steroidobacteraceae bacterium]|nr:ATP-binding protein [Steroidobacteraceae bacterium]